MKVFAALTLLVVTLGFSHGAVAEGDGSEMLPDYLSATGVSWTNQDGSVATTGFTPSSQPSVYTVSGHYVNNAVGFSCRGTPYPLSGVYYQPTGMISFSVAWSNASEDCQSATGWTGYIGASSSAITMTTDWNLAYMGSSGPQIEQGSDLFTLTTTVMSEGLLAQ